jgi:hypothetical protein
MPRIDFFVNVPLTIYFYGATLLTGGNMTAPEIRKKLEDRNLSVVAQRLDIGYQRLRRWNYGVETALKLDELQRLIEYLRK